MINTNFSLKSALGNLSNPVFITFDVDVFDWSVVRSTGTPEPGGLLWDEAIGMLLTSTFSDIHSGKREQKGVNLISFLPIILP